MIYNNITELIGRTPLVRLNKLTEGLDAEILVKVEFFNPGGSIKDRVALHMINEAEKAGLVNKDTLLIEPTSGNTGVGLAMVAASKGYRLILTMPETMSIERQKLLKAFGAQVILTPGAEGMQGSIDKAKEIAAENPNSFIPQQFENKDNPRAHSKTTVKEILQDTDSKLDIFVAGVGTGGTLTGIGQVLKQELPEVKIVAVEPYNSALLSGGKPGPHNLQGIGANFIPKILDRDIIDKIFPVKDEDAFHIARKLAKQEGLFVGITAGAAVHAALEIAKLPENKGKRIVVILPDTGERYLSTELFS